MNHNLLKGCKLVKLSDPVSAGTDGSFQSCTEIDTRGYAGCMIVFDPSVIATSGVLTTRVKNHTTTSTPGTGTINRVGTDLANNADTDDHKYIIHDIYKPKNRFITAQYQRTAGNVTIDGVWAILYNADNAPVTQGSDVETSQTLNAPVPSAS